MDNILRDLLKAKILLIYLESYPKIVWVLRDFIAGISLDLFLRILIVYFGLKQILAKMQQSTSLNSGFNVPSGVMRFNVSGTIIEMSREMLELYPKSLLRELAQKCPEGAEAFIDRAPQVFNKIILICNV